MSLTSVHTWVSGETLTYTQINSLDTNVTNAVDKRAGQTDTVASTLTVTGVMTGSGAGRFTGTRKVAANANTTYQMSDGISVIDASGDTASRQYTLSNTGAAAGDRVVVLGVSNSLYTTTVKNNGGTTLITLGVPQYVNGYGGGLVGGGSSTWAEFVHNGTNWILLASDWLEPLQIGFAFIPQMWLDTSTTTGSSPNTNQDFKLLTDTDFRPHPTGGHFRTVYTAGSAAYYYIMPLPRHLLRHQKTLSTVQLIIKPDVGHGGLPQQMPAVCVMRNAIGSYSGAPGMLLSTGNGWSVDPSASLVAYEPTHAITYTANQNNVIDLDSYVYSLVFMNEGGSNALTNLTCSGGLITFT